MRSFQFSNSDTSALCYSMKYMMHAGISGADSLTLIAEDEKRSAYKEKLLKMAEQADTGVELSTVFKDAGCFDNYVCEMVETGERTGRLEESLESVAVSCEKQANMAKQMRSALVYPCILLLIMLVVIAVVLIYVMPVFDQVYSQLGSGLTGIAAGLLNVGSALKSISPVLIVIFGIAVVFLALFSGVSSFRAKVLDLLWNSGKEGSVSDKINTANFARGLAMAMGSGMDIEEAIKVASKLPDNNSREKKRVEECLKLLNEGKTISEALKGSKLLPASECRMLDAGVRGGSGDRAMEQIADRLQDESEDAVSASVSKVEPTIVIISSVLTGLILLSVMIPLINIMSAIS